MGFFFCLIEAKEVTDMHRYVARLIDCGFSRDTAVFICRGYVRRNDWHGLELYIEAIEAEQLYSFEKEEMAK